MATLLLAHSARAQSPAKIPLSFLPPPLEHATYSLGIYDAKTGRLVRHLQEFAPESAFTAGLNGLLTSWDGKDDAGQPAAPGRYAARGYAVGAMKIAGEGILGNDWAAEDENLRIMRVQSIKLISVDDGVAILTAMAGGGAELLRFSGEDKLLWRKEVVGLPADARPWLLASDHSIAVMPRRASENGKVVRSVANYALNNGETNQMIVGVEETSVRASLPELPGVLPHLASPPAEFSSAVADPNLSLRSGVGAPSPTPHSEQKIPPQIGSHLRMIDSEGSTGKDHTLWSVRGLAGVVQTAADGTVLRRLEVAPGDPLPNAVFASTIEDRLYLLEEKPGWQRVRGLSWKEATQENGQPVSTWRTFIERSIRAPDPTLGLDAPAAPAETILVENPLVPGKPQKVRLTAAFDAHGSYLATADGLRLRPVSQRANLQAAKLIKGKAANALALYQYDGAATDEFSITGAQNLMAFDAGEFELIANGTEKPRSEKPAEPPDL